MMGERLDLERHQQAPVSVLHHFTETCLKSGGHTRLSLSYFFTNNHHFSNSQISWYESPGFRLQEGNAVLTEFREKGGVMGSITQRNWSLCDTQMLGRKC